MGDGTGPGSVGETVIAASMDGAGLLEGDVFATVNDRLARSFGFEDALEMEGVDWESLYPEAECERIRTEVLPAAGTEGEWHGVLEGSGEDGRQVTHRVTVQRSAEDQYVWIARELSGTAATQGTGTLGKRSSPDGGGTRVPVPEMPEPQVGDSASIQEIGGQDGDFEPLVENAPVPIIVFTRDSGIVYANGAAVDLIGAGDAETLLGEDPARFVHPDHREHARSRIRQVIEDAEATEPREYRLVGVDEAERYGEIATAPVAYEGSPGAYVVINDITSYKRSQRRLRQERRFIGNVIDTIDDILYVLDEDGETVLWNDTLAETTGYDGGEIESMSPAAFIAPDQHEYVPGLFEDVDTLGDQRVELDVLTKAGERVTHEFKGTTFEDPETGEVFRCGVARDITDRLERERRLERYETIVETVDDGVYALDEDLRFSFVNEGLCEMLDIPREDLLGRRVEMLMAGEADVETAETVREQVRQGDGSTGIITGTYDGPEGERVFESRYRLHPEHDGDFKGSVGVIRDITEREERKRQLEARLDELGSIAHINRILLDLTRDLVGSADQDAIERELCNRLATADHYTFAWIGDQAFDGDRLVLQTGAGETEGTLDALTGADGTTAARELATRAAAARTVQVVTAKDPAWEEWAAIGDAGGFRAVAAVPLHHEGTVYGVLMVHTDRDHAFEEREREGFDVLGRTVGFVINAVRSHKLLFTDTVVELEFRLQAADSLFARLASERTCELVLDGYVRSGQRWVLYVDVNGAPLSSVVEAAAEDPGVSTARVVRSSDGEGTIELVVMDRSVFDIVSHAGASVQSMVANPEGSRLVIDAPVETGVRDIVDPIRSEYPNATLVAQRERDNTVSDIGGPDGILESLTERQREVLEAAYLAGYFSWPRDSTANEVAESLDLASATLHGHLRKAEAEILTALFGAE